MGGKAASPLLAASGGMRSQAEVAQMRSRDAYAAGATADARAAEKPPSNGRVAPETEVSAPWRLIAGQ